MSYENLLLEQLEPGIQLLTINRPQALNALNSATLDELAQAIGRVAADQAARVLLVTGAGGKAFVAGADIGEMKDYTPDQARRFSERGMGVMHALESLPIPVIALVNGYALGGGCELALACDWIVAGDNAVFGQPEVNLGIPPGFGGTQRLRRRVGRARAVELLTTARQVKAEEALRIGLANHVHPATELKARGIEAARTIAGKGPAAVRLAKEAARRGEDLDLANACALETALFALAFAAADQKEGMSAFLEKRPARFTAR
ncbi:MAG: enoyl-CoA hydratase-related protein [Betaproteobacteria bacterium]|nr:enoyl-CoA hydratase-related protein [Betaproteobacteria bacterium]